MVRSKIVGFLFDAWDDFDRVVRDVHPAAMLEQLAGGSSFAWTAGHAAYMVDRWINVRFQGYDPHPLVGEDRFRIGGDGSAKDWSEVQAGVEEVRARARKYLETLEDSDLALVVPYEGTFLGLWETGLELRFAVLRASVHHYFHIGEIASKRVTLGQDVGDYPGEPRWTV
jgi:DinB superfamily